MLVREIIIRCTAWELVTIFSFFKMKYKECFISWCWPPGAKNCSTMPNINSHWWHWRIEIFITLHTLDVIQPGFSPDSARMDLGQRSLSLWSSRIQVPMANVWPVVLGIGTTLDSHDLPYTYRWYMSRPQSWLPRPDHPYKYGWYRFAWLIVPRRTIRLGPLPGPIRFPRVIQG